ncbi:MAG TPA: SBBP repeat-containing protein, partial [Thermoanaerobaculia bacterium]|nr:SBBP repeat-containing protein [Thermoanaerobaculia bacterium]
TLVIDPLIYSTFLGGTGNESPKDFTLDSAGSAYIVGGLDSTDFPTVNAAQSSPAGNYDAFIAKLAPDGSSFTYATYLGGSGYDLAWSIATDDAGDAYVAGITQSTDFPTTAGVVAGTNPGLGIDGFLAKLDPYGSLIYSTYYGSNEGRVLAIDVDKDGNAYVCGETPKGFALPASPTPTTIGPGGGFRDILIAKLNTDASAILYQTVIGGGDGSFIATSDVADDRCLALVVDGSGRVDFFGNSSSDTATDGFPATAGSFQDTFGGGTRDAVVGRLAADGGSLDFMSYLGGSDGENDLSGSLNTVGGIGLDSGGNIAVCGHTRSADFPTVNAAQPANAGSNDAFVSRIAPSGASLIFSTYLGGTDNDQCQDLVIGPGDTIFIAGTTSSVDFPQVKPLGNDVNGLNFESFLGRLATDGTLTFASHFGVSYERIVGLAVDPGEAIYLGAYTGNGDFPMLDPAQGTYNGGVEALLVKLTLDPQGPSIPIPALGRWGLLGLALILAGIAMLALARRRA